MRTHTSEASTYALTAQTSELKALRAGRARTRGRGPRSGTRCRQVLPALWPRVAHQRLAPPGLLPPLQSPEAVRYLPAVWPPLVLVRMLTASPLEEGTDGWKFSIRPTPISRPRYATAAKTCGRAATLSALAAACGPSRMSTRTGLSASSHAGCGSRSAAPSQSPNRLSPNHAQRTPDRIPRTAQSPMATMGQSRRLAGRRSPFRRRAPRLDNRGSPLS